jgi:hypothetical protein
MHYLSHYEREFAKARRTVKRRASGVLIAAGVGNTVVVVIGGVVTTWSALSWMGILSSGLAAGVAALLAWDNHFKHRDLWIQRSVILHRIQEIRRTSDVDLRLASPDRQQIALKTIDALNDVLREDIKSWSDMRGATASSEPGVQTDPKT